MDLSTIRLSALNRYISSLPNYPDVYLGHPGINDYFLWKTYSLLEAKLNNRMPLLDAVKATEKEMIGIIEQWNKGKDFRVKCSPTCHMCHDKLWAFWRKYRD
jgi:hypothetical protein